MLVVMEVSATPAEVEGVMQAIAKLGLRPHAIPGEQRTAIGITGNRGEVDPSAIENLPGVKELIHVSHPYKLVSREFYREDSVIDVAGVKIGGKRLVVMAGPCAIESPEQTLAIAQAVASAGAHILRGGAFKPRTSPYSFQGLGLEGLKILRDVGREVGLPTVTEVIDSESLELAGEYADMIQVGARNMQNFSLLKRCGRTRKPVLLKRGMSATIEEFLMSAEYVMSEGNHALVLCERGVRTFADHTRNTLDLSAIPAVKRTSHLPIIVDPSHGTGKRSKVGPLARAAVAVGADGLMIEVHHKPEEALSDGPQALPPSMFAALMEEIAALAPVVHRTL